MSKRIKLLKLGREFISIGGTFSGLTPPRGKPTAHDSKKNVKFWADLVQIDLEVQGQLNTTASIGLCSVGDRDPANDPLEFHESTGEGILPLGEDIILFVAKAGASEPLKREDILAFRVPGDTIVSLPKGTWHWAPLPFHRHTDGVSVVIILPPQTYRRDCVVRNVNLGLSVHRG